PWFLQQTIDYMRDGTLTPAPELHKQYVTLIGHLDEMLTHYGSHAGLRIARKHIGWYSKGLAKSADFRADVNRTDDAESAREKIKAFYETALEAA
ncbi:MAG: tRNA-dihydrouridine synthase, partial [Alphaproteobacteria bacterium]|nr:tRNA-dihydrouridine synthase [Alphaproteobacteria bacterium]